MRWSTVRKLINHHDTFHRHNKVCGVLARRAPTRCRQHSPQDCYRLGYNHRPFCACTERTVGRTA